MFCQNKFHAAWALSAILLLAGTAWGEPVLLYVAPNGADANPGTKAKPFATVTRARDELRKLKSTGALKDGANVLLREGRYALAETLKFEPADSGTPSGPIVYSAYSEEKAVLSGGTAIKGWRKHDERLWVAEVPWARGGGPGFAQLFVNDARRPRARTPNAGAYFYTKRLHFNSETFPQALGFSYFSGDIPSPQSLSNAVVVLFHNWVNSYNYIGKLDTDRRRLDFARPAGIFFLGPEVRYYVENVFGALDAPGEWYLDTAKGELFYYPMPGENLAKADVVAARVGPVLVKLEGDFAQGKYVEHLEFRGLSFQHSAANLERNYPHSVQGAHTQLGALLAVGARQVTVRNCDFAHLGEHAVSLREGCVSNVVQECHLHDLGAGGVYLSAEAPRRPSEAYVTAHNRIDNNFIHDGGHIFRAGCGVFLGGSASFNEITHNEVCDLNWVGIHAGWSWTGLVPTHTHDNVIAFNHLHHLGNGVLNDLAGIYTLGVSQGTVLHHNFIHDIARFERGKQGYGAWGIYLDAGSSLITVESNVVCRTRDGGFHGHCDEYAHENLVRNNVFAFAQDGQMARNNHKETNTYHVRLEHNIIYNRTNLMFSGNNWKAGSKFESDYNCFWSEQTPAPDFFKQPFAAWQKAGRDAHSVIADPQFVDAAKDDYRLRSSSPALALGIKSVDVRAAGLYGARSWRNLPAGLTHRLVERGLPKNEQVQTMDFEDFEPGETPPDAVAKEGGAFVAVTDEKPASGKRCLRFVDAPDATSWKPHWYVMRTPGTGTVRASCSVRNDPAQPGTIHLEFRDWFGGSRTDDSYATGPFVQFLANGDVQAAAGAQGWTTLGRVPLGEWARLEVEFPEGQPQGRTWSVRLTSAGGVNVSRTGLPFHSPDFKVCTWFGVSGADKKSALFYLDDFHIE